MKIDPKLFSFSRDIRQRLSMAKRYLLFKCLPSLFLSLSNSRLVFGSSARIWYQ